MNYPLLSYLGIVCLVAAACAGCTGTSGDNGKLPDRTPVGTPVLAGNIVVTEEQDGARVTVDQGSTITLKLAENPTTGYQWNLTVFSGLTVMDDTYEPSDKTGTMAGSGGTRIWEIKAAAPGLQAIDAVYMRSWEPVTGNETAFAMTVEVTAA